MKKILLIDDDEDFNRSLKDYLENEGYSVVSAENGKVGLKKIQETDPDLIITDIVMPETDGMELLTEIKNNPNIFSKKIIAISGGGRMDRMLFLEIAKNLGADCVFDKPLDIDALVESVGALLGE